MEMSRRIVHQRRADYKLSGRAQRKNPPRKKRGCESKGRRGATAIEQQQKTNSAKCLMASASNFPPSRQRRQTRRPFIGHVAMHTCQELSARAQTREGRLRAPRRGCVQPDKARNRRRHARTRIDATAITKQGCQEGEKRGSSKKTRFYRCPVPCTGRRNTTPNTPDTVGNTLAFGRHSRRQKLANGRSNLLC